jgi:hypothetical protein
VFSRDAGITISRKIDEVKGVIDTIKINGLCPTRCVAGESQALPPGESVEQAGLPYVASP